MAEGDVNSTSVMRTLKSDFCKYFTGSKLHWLRFCLCDQLPIGSLDGIGAEILNNLKDETEFETFVNLLKEIAELTNIKGAIKCVVEFRSDNSVRNSESELLTNHRKTLFKALRQVGEVDFRKVVSAYNLHSLDLKNIWEVVFYLEKELKLDNTPQKLKTFGKLLNAKSQNILGLNSEESKPLLEHPSNLQSGLNSEESKPLLEHAGNLQSEMVPFEIYTRGPDAQKAYTKALQEGKKCLRQTRLMLIGSERVGKTSLVRALTGQKFDPNEESTNGIETLSLKHITNWKPTETKQDKGTIYVKAVGEYIAKNQQKLTTDSKGGRQEIQPSLKYQEEKSPSVANRPNYPSEVKHEREKADEMATDTGSEFVPNVREEIPEEIIEEVLLHGEANKETEESEDDLSLSIWDFAGQKDYYITHQIFLVFRAIYIVCFNLCDFHQLLDFESIIFWLQSIHSNTPERSQPLNQEHTSPPVFIVGTHRNSLPGTPEKRDELAEKRMTEITEKIEDTFGQHVVGTFAVDNKPVNGEIDKNILELRNCITKIAKEEPYMKESIPIKWLKFLRQIVTLKLPIIDFNKAKDLSEDCYIPNNQLIYMLQFFHELGDIIYYGEHNTPNSTLNNIVILDLNWMIKVLCQVFTAKKTKRFTKLWKLLNEKGILDENLLKHVWQDIPEATYEGMLQLMIKFDLLCEKNPLEFENRQFYVPSMIKDTNNEMPSLSESFMLYIDFHGFLPVGLFQRFVVRLMEQALSKRVGFLELSYQRVDISLDEDHDVIVRIQPSNNSVIQIAIIYRASSDEAVNKPQPAMCIELVKFLNDYFKSSVNTLMKRRIQFDINILCDVCKKFKKLKDCLMVRRRVYCEMAKNKRMNTEMIHQMFDPGERQSIVQSMSSEAPFQNLSNRSDEQEFQDFCNDFCNHYPGIEYYQWLKFLLRDNIDLNELAKDGVLHLLNELERKGLISCTNVSILLDISEVTKMAASQKCVRDYLANHKTRKETGLKPYRRKLFEALRQTDETDVNKIADYYKLRPYGYGNIWDMVSHLEISEILNVKNEESVKKFACLLNNMAKSKLGM